MFFLVLYKESVIKNRNDTCDNRSIYCSLNMIYILNRKCKTGNMLYINHCSCISFITANPFSIKGKPQMFCSLHRLSSRASCIAGVSQLYSIFLLDWRSKIAVQALVDHTQLLVVWRCLHHWSLCQLAFLPICRAFVMKEWHIKIDGTAFRAV